MTAPERVRLFVAADVPEPQRRAVNDAVAAVRRESWGGRWSSPESQHVTLKFLGWTPEDRIEAVAQAAAAVAAGRRPAPVRIDGLGAFPSLRRARVLWAGVADPSGLLTGLAEDLDSTFEALGYGVEKRPFRPHLTLARWRSPVRLEGLPPRPWGELEPFEVRGFRLYRSRLHPHGARYEVLATLDLGRAATAPEAPGAR
jgi:RNA 2',3'-cyclic 3'-phosphodiesterase